MTKPDPCAHCSLSHVACDANLDLYVTPCCKSCTHDHSDERDRSELGGGDQ